MPATTIQRQTLWSLHPPYHTVLQWFSMMSLVVFAFFLLGVTGLLQIALASDRTYISLAILALLLISSGYCGYRAYWLSRQHVYLDKLLRHIPVSGSTSLAADYLDSQPEHSPQASLPDNLQAQQPLVDVYSDRARSGHEVIWFLSGTMIKAGLVGTVIGFVQMLASVATLESFDISQMQDVLKNMSSGMGVALYTTLVGISANVILSAQAMLLDRSADKLVANTVRLACQTSR